MVDMRLLGEFKKIPSLWEMQREKGKNPDWTHFLSSNSVSVLKGILERAFEHRHAYHQSGNVKAAQLWSALIEMQKEIEDLKAQVDKLTPKEKLVYRLDEPEPKEDPVVEIIEEAIKPSANDTREADQALLDSLMKF